MARILSSQSTRAKAIVAAHARVNTWLIEHLDAEDWEDLKLVLDDEVSCDCVYRL